MLRRLAPLALILLAAAGLRVAWALGTEVNPRLHFLADASWYDRQANHLAWGMGLVEPDGAPTARWPPGYPALLAAVYLAFGRSVLTAKLLNVALGTLTCLSTYGIGARLVSRRVGLLAAALLAGAPGDVAYVGLTLSETAFSCVFTGVLLAFACWNDGEGGGVRWLAFGAAIGAASLVRGAALLFPLVPLAVWLATLGPSRATLRRAALTAAGLALVLAPWTLRNLRALDAPVLLASTGTYALFLAHNPYTEGTQNEAVVDFHRRRFRAERALPRPAREVVLSRAEAGYAVRYALSHPVRELRLVPKRIAALFAHGRYAIRFSQVPYRKRGEPTPVWLRASAVAADVWLFGALLLALPGFALLLRTPGRRAWIVPLSAAYFVALHGVLFVSHARYNAPLAPLLALGAAAALAWGLRRARPRAPGERPSQGALGSHSPPGEELPGAGLCSAPHPPGG